MKCLSAVGLASYLEIIGRETCKCFLNICHQLLLIFVMSQQETIVTLSNWYMFIMMFCMFIGLLSDKDFPRLAQLILDYESPLKKLMEEFVPHSKVRRFWSERISRVLEIRPSGQAQNALVWMFLLLSEKLLFLSFFFEMPYRLWRMPCCPCKLCIPVGTSLPSSGEQHNFLASSAPLGTWSTPLSPTRYSQHTYSHLWWF